ncbi:MAG: hypothetical protein HOJ35_03790 [Bdellovibrionales bacterium]|nr:hypothetical protein [Bdellovibrionales bacterium]
MLEKQKIVIIGFGSQAKSWALNLRDSGWLVHILLRENSQSLEIATNLNFDTLTLGKSSLENFSNFAMLTPDHTHQQILSQYQSYLPKKSRLIYAHGFSLVKNDLNKIFPNFIHLLLAPKSIASELRFLFETKGKIAAAISTEFSTNTSDKDFLLGLAKDLGITTGPFETNFQEETYTDLFSEQSILCSAIPYISKLSFEKLRAKGVSPELAFIECWHEMKLIVDTIFKLGPIDFFKLISPNALIGGEKGRKVLFDQQFQKKLDILLDDIWEGRFTEEIDSCNFEQTKDEIIERWSASEFHTIYNKLNAELKN